jgi:hypothetical protein
MAGWRSSSRETSSFHSGIRAGGGRSQWRGPILATVPTVEETGFSGEELPFWCGLRCCRVRHAYHARNPSSENRPAHRLHATKYAVVITNCVEGASSCSRRWQSTKGLISERLLSGTARNCFRSICRPTQRGIYVAGSSIVPGGISDLDVSHPVGQSDDSKTRSSRKDQSVGVRQNRAIPLRPKRPPVDPLSI